ncbi:MAG: methyltransferase domain-containing protein [Spirochaetia bacterium]|nr:methyltransferase domain-containing protein [Spirochaetia bacterium]
MKELIKNNVSISIEGDIYTIQNLPAGDYDEKAIFYDKLMSNILYNMFMWGNKPVNYTKFAESSILNSKEGLALDIGCGSLSFTHNVYRNYNDRKLYLSDLSMQMLKIGKNRIGKTKPNLKYLRANALDFPFKSESIQTILSFGFIHVVKNIESLIDEFHRLLKINGDLHITCLCVDRKISKKYLNFLKRKGLVAHCLTSNDIENIIQKKGFETKKQVIGGMAYIDAIKKK